MNWFKQHGLRLAGFVVLVSSVVFGWIAVDARIAHERFVECQARVTDALILSWQARNLANEKDRLALKEVFLTVTNATTREQTRTALTKYNQAIATSDEERKANPIPPPPRTACP